MVAPGYEGPYLLGIDFGTESCRAGIFDLRGTPLGFAATGYPTYHPHPGWAEQDPEDWWSALQASIRRVLEQTGIPGRKIAGIGYDATTMTVVPMDKNGREIRRAIMWMDVRAIEQMERVLDYDHWAKLYNGGKTTPPTAEWYPFKAAWLKENDTEVYRRAYRIVDAPDWLTYKLTGEWTININSAAMRMNYNSDYGGWPVDYYEQIGAGDVFEKMPQRVEELGVPLGGLLPSVAQDLGLIPGIPVAQGCADAWAGQIGLGAVYPGKVSLTTGSSHVIAAQSSKPVYGNGFMGSYTDGVITGQYTLEGSLVSSGSVLKWFKDGFCRDLVRSAETVGVNPYEVLDKKCAKLPPGSEGLIVNEYFQGNRTPYTDSKARGLMWGLSLSHTQLHVYHAIMEAVAYGTAYNFRKMEDAGFAFDQVTVCGGATKSKLWMQMHADVSGKPFIKTKVGDAVALGSCILAAVGGSQYGSIQEAVANMVHEDERIEPNPDTHEEYQFYLQKYMESYPAIQELTHQLVDHVARGQS